MLNEKALKAGEYVHKIELLEKENDSALKGWQSLQKWHEEVSADNDFLKKKVQDLQRDMRNEDAIHQDQLRVLKNTNDRLEREKASVKDMLDMAVESVATDKRKLEEKVARLEAEISSLSAVRIENEKLRSGEVLIEEAYNVACRKLFESPAWEDA